MVSFRPSGGRSSALSEVGSLGALDGVYTASTPGARSAAAVSALRTRPRAMVLVTITAYATFATGISAE